MKENRIKDGKSGFCALFINPGTIPKRYARIVYLLIMRFHWGFELKLTIKLKYFTF